MERWRVLGARGDEEAVFRHAESVAGMTHPCGHEETTRDLGLDSGDHDWGFQCQLPRGKKDNSRPPEPSGDSDSRGARMGE